MTTQTLSNDCQFCSVISKTNGEDPIGTANPADGWVIVEIPQPWTKESMMAHPALSGVFQELHQGQRKLMPMAIAPDPQNSTPGCVRLLYYQRPATPFAQFDKQEFLFAPTLLDLPTGQFWGHLEPDVLDCLVQRDSPVTKLHQFYRGWAGLTKFEQIVEREIWMQQGWDWLNYHKSAQILAQDTANDERNPDWAEIRLEFTSPDGRVQGAYEARVEVCGSVMSAINSGNEQPLQEVKQYRVSRLTPIKSN